MQRLTFKEYINLAMRTANKEAIMDADLYADVKYQEECAELIGLIAKEHFHKMKIPREKYVEEIGDIFWFLAFRNKYCVFKDFYAGITGYIDCDYDMYVKTGKKKDGIKIMNILSQQHWIYIDDIMEFMNHKGITLSEVLIYNIKKLKKRYPEGYNHDACERRVDVVNGK